MAIGLTVLLCLYFYFHCLLHLSKDGFCRRFLDNYGSDCDDGSKEGCSGPATDTPIFNAYYLHT